MEEKPSQYTESWYDIAHTRQAIAAQRRNQRQIVADRLGKYYFQFDSDIRYAFSLYKKDEGLLRKLLQESSGLLEPVYTIDNNKVIIPDWQQTARIHAWLTQKIGLKLLPLQLSRKLHEKNYAFVNRVEDYVGLFMGGNNKRSANLFAFQNTEYFPRVLQAFAGQAAYLIRADMTLGDMLVFSAIYAQHRAKGREAAFAMSSYYESMLKTHLQGIHLEMVPLIYYKNQKHFGYLKYPSGVSVVDVKKLVTMIAQHDYRVLYDKDNLRQLIAARKLLYQKMLIFCAEAIRRFKITGKIQSRPF